MGTAQFLAAPVQEIPVIQQFLCCTIIRHTVVVDRFTFDNDVSQYCDVLVLHVSSLAGRSILGQ